MKSDNSFIEEESNQFPTSRSGKELWSIARNKFKALGALKLTHLHHADTLIIKNGLNQSLSEIHKIGLLFHPSKGFVFYWDQLVSLNLLYSCIPSPLLLAFGYSKSDSIGSYIDIITDFIMIIDILFKFNTSYYTTDRTLSKSHQDVVRHYLTTWFLFDFFASFPYELINFTEHDQNKHIGNIILRLANNRRLWMLSRALRLVKLFWKKFRIFNYTHSMSKLLETLLRLFIAIHLFSCFFLISAEIENSPDSWTYRFGIEDSENQEKYMYSFYFMLTTMSTVGYGDITPRTWVEISIAIIWMFIAVYFLSFSISSISSLVTEADFKKNALAQKMKIIESYAKSEGINKLTQNKMKIEVTDKIYRLTHSAEDRIELLTYLPIDLKYEIAFTMQRGILNDIPFFRSKRKEFVGNIFPLLCQKFLITEEIVFLQNQSAEEIFFIAEGKISLIYGTRKVPFKFLFVGDYFGDYEVTHEVKRVFGTVSKHFTKLLVMSSEVASKFKRDFPSMWIDFKDEAKQRHEVNIKAMSEMMVIKKINGEGSIKNLTGTEVKKMIQVQMAILTHTNLDFSLEEMRKREVVKLKKIVLAQRDMIFNVLHGMKFLRI